MSPLNKAKQSDYYFDIVSYYNDEDVINKWINEKSGAKNKIKMHGIIGAGSFGQIIDSIYYSKNGSAATVVKKIVTNIKYADKEKIKRKVRNIVLEIKYSIYMGQYNVGPTIYEAFYTQNRETLTCYIVMEKFDSSIESIYYLPVSIKEYDVVHNSMLSLLEKQVFELSMYCTDIKPENYVIKRNGKHTKIRSIDYGTDWCIANKMPREFVRKEYFFCTVLIQLCLKIYIHIDKKYVDILGSFYRNKIIINCTNNFRNFTKLRNVMVNVISSPDGEQIKYYFIEVIEEIINLHIDERDTNGIIYSILYIYNQIKNSISFSQNR